MKKVKEMRTQEIKRELENIEWEYIVAAELAQSDEHYTRLSERIDNRKIELERELTERP